LDLFSAFIDARPECEPLLVLNYNNASLISNDYFLSFDAFQAEIIRILEKDWQLSLWFFNLCFPKNAA
jgi:hypothetical protein